MFSSVGWLTLSRLDCVSLFYLRGTESARVNIPQTIASI